MSDTIHVQVVTGGVVTNTIVVDAASTISTDGMVLSLHDGGSLEAAEGSTFVAAENVGIGFAYDGRTFTAPVVPPPVIDLKAYAAAARFAKETGGITVGTAPIATDRESQAMINGAWSAAQMNSSITVQWKTSAGFVALNAAQIQAIASAVATHVQACFAAEAQVDAAITANTIATSAQVDAAFAAVTA